jgi:hypothetical protein
METLTAFCKRKNLPKSSVRKVLLSHGHTTSNGLSDETVQFAEAHFAYLERQRKIASEFNQIDAPEHLQRIDNKILAAEVKGIHHDILHKAKMLNLEIERLKLIVDQQQERIGNLEYQLAKNSDKSDQPNMAFIPNPFLGK